MRIWVVTVGEPSPVDGPAVRLHRGGLLSRYLKGLGHDVVSFNGTVEHSTRRQRFDATTITHDDDGITRAYLYGRSYKRTVSVDRIVNNIQVGLSFLEAAKKLEKPDVIVCSYPPIELAFAVRHYARRHKIPYVVDLRDKWPDIIVDVAPEPLRPLARLAMFHWFWQARAACRDAAGIVGVSGPFLDWGVGMAGHPRRASDRVFHLANDPEEAPPEDIAKAEAFWDAAGVTADKDVLVFCGMYSPRHDFETVINGVHALPEGIRNNLRLVFCGKGEAEDRMRAAAKGAPYIVFAGWRNLADIQSLFRRAKAGLMPYPSTQDFTISYPNKVGEYLSGGLPIITSLSGVIENMIRTEKCGALYAEGDAASFACTVAAFLADEPARKDMSVEALRVYARDFNPKQIYADYAAYIEGLAK